MSEIIFIEAEVSCQMRIRGAQRRGYPSTEEKDINFKALLNIAPSDLAVNLAECLEPEIIKALQSIQNCAAVAEQDARKEKEIAAAILDAIRPDSTMALSA